MKVIMTKVSCSIDPRQTKERDESDFNQDTSLVKIK